MVASMQCQTPPMQYPQNAMGGAHLHMPQSIFQHMMEQNSPQPAGPCMQMPQVPPLSIPWSVPALQQPKLIRFTGSGFVSNEKRKFVEEDYFDTRQTKKFITEEKMAAHFKDLHISSNYQPQNLTPTPTPDPVPSTSTADAQIVCQKELNMELELDANTVDVDQAKSVHPKLVLSEELKRLQQEPILPSSLLSKLERPSMALVLWEPPSKHLRMLPTRDTPTPIPNASDDNNNNNNENIPNLNRTLSVNSNTQSMFEPMEL